MKRHGGLFEQCCKFEHLLLAYKKARKGSNTPEAKRFGFFLEHELLALQASLKNGRYRPAPYRYFQIHDPKQRTISVAPFIDRVVHHALVAILEPIYEPSFIHHSYATRKEKGVHKALQASQQMLRVHPWFFKADIKQFFDSISHQKLIEIIERKVKDASVLDLTRKIIGNGGSFGKGLPIGNLTSQFFANVYLNPFDHFILQKALPKLAAGAYIRYMDDFVCFVPSRKDALAMKAMIKEWLWKNLGLVLNPNSSFINQKSNGLRFLGARLYPTLKRLHRVNQRRFKRRMAYRLKQYQLGKMEEKAFVDSMNSYWSHLSHFDALQFKKILLEKHHSLIL